MVTGIIGLGKLGSIHLRICKENKNTKKIYVADIDKEKIPKGYGNNFFTDYKKLPESIDMVNIATPTPTHFKIAKFFLKRRIPTFVEKPLTQNIKESSQLINIAKKNKTLLFVGHVERYNNAYIEAKKIIKNPLFIECHRLNPYPERSLETSVVLDLMIHDLDIILDLAKDKIKKIDAKGVKVISATEDIANAHITFKNGCVTNITSSRISSKKERKLRVFMTNNYVSLDYANQKVETYKKIKNKIIEKHLLIDKEEPLKKEIETFINLVKNKTFSLEYAKKAKNALKLALKIQRIIESSSPCL